ncbi:MAG: hypothetical protein P4L41_18235 [Flavipsychrobacter sp.]|nr:hypothetical protein [Flavipsychrobacter sp.]
MKNILSILFAVCVCIAFASCSSGDYNANPANGGTTIVKNDTTKKDTTTTPVGPGPGTGTATYTATSGTFTATINGTSWTADLSSIKIVYDSATKEAIIMGNSGSGSSAQGLELIMLPFTGATTYPISSDGTTSGALLYILGISPTQASSGSIVLTTYTANHYVGTFTAVSSSNPNFVQGGTFDIHL